MPPLSACIEVWNSVSPIFSSTVTSGIRCKKQVPKKTPPPKQLAILVYLSAFFILDALNGASPKKKGSTNMTSIPPHFAPIDARDSAATSDPDSDNRYQYILSTWPSAFSYKIRKL